MKDEIYPMNAIEWAAIDLHSYAHSNTTRELVDSLTRLLCEENATNIVAQIPRCRTEEETLNVSDLSWGEDFEIVTGNYRLPDGEELTEAERDEEIEKVADRLCDIHGEMERLEAQHDPDVAMPQNRAGVEARQEALTEEEGQLEDRERELENAEYEEDEIHWNTVYRFDGRVNTDLAQRLGFGVLRLNRDLAGPSLESYAVGDEFMFLQGCGMDLSPQFAAYMALEDGALTDEYARKLREPDYFRNVVGEDVFQEVVQRLGVAHLVDIAEEESKCRMEEFDASIASIQKARDEGGMDSALAGLAAMSAFCKSQG